MGNLKISDDQTREYLNSLSSKGDKIAGIVCRTPLFLNQNNGSEIKAFYSYKFEGISLTWINPLVLTPGTEGFSCVRIFAIGKRRHRELLTSARHFAGLISFMSGKETIIEAGNIKSNPNEPTLDVMVLKQDRFVLNTYTYLSHGTNIGDLLDIVCNPSYPIDDKALLALSHIFEASSSFNNYWTYLCYWKILEILHGRVTPSIEGGGIQTYLNSNAPLNFNHTYWTNKYPDTFRRLYGTRNAVSHWQNGREKSIKDPADERLKGRIEEDLPILWVFVRYALNPYLGLTAY